MLICDGNAVLRPLQTVGSVGAPVSGAFEREVMNRGRAVAVASFAHEAVLHHAHVNGKGARVDVDLGKRDPADFALWKFAKPGEPEAPVSYVKKAKELK